MAQRSRNLRKFGMPLLFPGTAAVTLGNLGDSHSSYNSGATERWIYGLCKSMPINLKGIFSPNGSFLCAAINSGAGALLDVGPTQHGLDGCIAPHPILSYTYGSAVASDQLIHRLPYDAAVLARIRGGNPFAGVAVNFRIAWWARATSLQTCRSRAYDSDFSTLSEDITLDMRTAGTAVGSAGYRYRDFALQASADGPLLDFLTGAENESNRELTIIGSRVQLPDPTGGVTYASIGNGGQTATAYLDPATICSDARYLDWLRTFGPFDRTIIPLGTNMTGPEAADIVNVWGAKVLGLAQRWNSLNRQAGAQDPMVCLVTGHDANITSRLADMATAIDNCSQADSAISHFDSAGALPNYAEMNATYLADGVHFNGVGAVLTAASLGAALQAACGVPSGSSGLRNRQLVRG